MHICYLVARPQIMSRLDENSLLFQIPAYSVFVRTVLIELASHQSNKTFTSDDMLVDVIWS